MLPDLTKNRPEDEGTMPRMENVMFFVAVDPLTGDEGLLTMPTVHGVVPMIAVDQKRVDSLMPMAHRFARQNGMKVKLVRFSNREEIMEISGGDA